MKSPVSFPTRRSNSKAFTKTCAILQLLHLTPTNARSGSSKLHLARSVVRSGRQMLLSSSDKLPHISTLFKPNLGRRESPPNCTYTRQYGTSTDLPQTLCFSPSRSAIRFRRLSVNPSHIQLVCKGWASPLVARFGWRCSRSPFGRWVALLGLVARFGAWLLRSVAPYIHQKRQKGTKNKKNFKKFCYALKCVCMRF